MSIRRTTCVGLLLLAACHDAPVTPAAHRPTNPTRMPLGVVEITISNLGAQAAAARVARVRPLDFSAPDGGNGTGGIQLAPVSTGTFTVGKRGAGGERYFYATFQVRNATTGGTAYTTARTNLTFLAVATGGTINGTAISQLAHFDGSAADPSIAAQITPTGMVFQNGGASFASAKPDVIQLMAESEVGSTPGPAGVTTIFPYGFVTSNPNTANSRTLPANPAVGQFDGLVTFAFKYPLQASAANDPYTVSAVFLALDDSQTRLTQSLEEQDPTATAAFEARATALGATSVTLLGGGSYTGTAATRTICAVRIAGTAASPTGFAFGSIAHFLSLSPNPYALAGQFISSTSSLSATFDTVVTNATSATFVVNGSQSGRQFLGQTYSGSGTTTVGTPAGSFLPGEEIETTVTAAPGLACPTPWVGRLRVAPTVSSVGGTFAADTTITVAAGAVSTPILADLNGDGRPDLIVATGNSKVAVFLNNGSGGFGAETDYSTTSVAAQIVVADFNGDGRPDIAVTGPSGATVDVLLNNGDGTFAPKVDYSVGPQPSAIAATDLNGDGKLDIVVANSGNSTLSVLVGNGDGTFQPTKNRAGVSNPVAIVFGDFNKDGIMDMAVAGASTIRVYRGHGDGTFSDGADNNVGFSPGGLAVGDFNGDGNLDIVFTCGSTTTCMGIILGNGDGAATFQSATTFTTGNSPLGIVVGDFDGDGKLDVATANSAGNTVSVLLGTGAGTFGTNTDFPAGTGAAAIATGDVNHDGKLDLVTANTTDVTVSILRRN